MNSSTPLPSRRASELPNASVSQWRGLGRGTSTSPVRFCGYWEVVWRPNSGCRPSRPSSMVEMELFAFLQGVAR